ncbi:MAG: hypothetical protein NHF93_01000 [Candidatus Shikimatogenerans bostrichidophilus]|nr:MAG: hypothetical protein NHF93_01000 [Candidatus Shikimatogenerans bostrichidophilus]
MIINNNNNIKLINDKRLFIIDSLLYIYKYYFYLRKYYKGNYILYGFLKFIIDILIKKKPTYIVAIFDSKLKENYKKIFFLNYKNNRKKIPTKISKTIPYIKKYLNILNIPIFYIKNYEADDVIGSLIKKKEKEGYINYIITEDKDYLQLISKKTFILNYNKKIFIDNNYIFKKYNINNINKIIDYFSIVGDITDNIPGIPNIGSKKTNKLLNIYNDIETIFLKKNIKYIEKNFKFKIKKYKYLAKISKKLFKINTKIKILKKKNFFLRKKIQKKKIIKILLNLNKKFFKKKIKEINYFFI